MRRFLLALLLAAAPAHAQDWPRDLYDPAPEDEPADLVLPMPCGGAMAFQKVTVPVDAADPLADRRVRLGQTLDTHVKTHVFQAKARRYENALDAALSGPNIPTAV